MNEHDIHLWYIPLSENFFFLNHLFVLSCDEKEKANDFHFEHLKKTYIIRRHALRYILSLYCNMQPQELKFKYTTNKKPFLSHNSHNLQFNLSDSQEMAILAITKQSLIGVDVECVRQIDNVYELAEQFFSKLEFENFLASSDKQLKFYKTWVKKEAISKALDKEFIFTSYESKRQTINNRKNELYNIDITNKLSFYEFSFYYLQNLYVSIIARNHRYKNVKFFYYQENV